MKSLILLLAFSAIILGGCTTAYKTGQTPDDVYYSPERPQDEYVRVDKKDNDRYYQGDESYYEDRYLRMKVQNRYQWSDLDDWYFYNNRYNYSHYNNYYWNNPWNPYSYWNQYYNPYGPSVIIANPKSNYTYNKPRTFNLNMYNNTNNQQISGNANHPLGNSNNGVRIFGSSNNTNTRSSNTTSNPGRSLRDIFSGSNNSSNNSNSVPDRSSTNSSNNNSSSNSGSSNSSSGSSGSNAPVRKF